MLQSIQTRYAGYFFRSRTEARYAVMLHALGVDFEFELQGWQLPRGSYLPDFYLPRLSAWLEVKGREPLASDFDICQSLADESGQSVYLTDGPPNWLTACHVLRPGLPPERMFLNAALRQWECFDPDIAKAIVMAQSARFEFGETPTAPQLPLAA